MGSVSNFVPFINFIIVLVNVREGFGIWPPPYSVNLSHEETFVISELLENKDIQDVYDEEEIIQKEDLAERLNLIPEDEKYFRMHKEAHRYNNKYEDKGNYNNNSKKIIEESNFDIEEPVPWKAGLVDEKGRFNQDEDAFYFDEEAQYNLNKHKRSDDNLEEKNDSISYDYNKFKAEYENNIKEVENSTDTLKYSTVKEEESLKDSVKEMVDFKKTPRNCTVEEMRGIGLGAVECFWMELEKPRMKSRVFEKAIRIVIIWVVLYVIVAIPCWCQFGWGCCCCRCKFCRPRENIKEVQKFFAQNPIGTYHDEEGNEFTYKPTSYEKYAYKKLEKELNRL